MIVTDLIYCTAQVGGCDETPTAPLGPRDKETAREAQGGQEL
eukprot:COSAG03_NODE_524_length_7177_cov_6.485872_4_plen_42_part_00